MNSRNKGKRGERLWRDVLRDAGFLKSYRGQQYQGGTDSPDVVCPELPDIHFEVKFVQALQLWAAFAQATGDANGKIAVIAHKRNNSPWLCIMSAEDFFKLVKGNHAYAQGHEDCRGSGTKAGEAGGHQVIEVQTHVCSGAGTRCCSTLGGRAPSQHQPRTRLLGSDDSSPQIPPPL